MCDINSFSARDKACAVSIPLWEFFSKTQLWNEIGFVSSSKYFKSVPYCKIKCRYVLSKSSIRFSHMVPPPHFYFHLSHLLTLWCICFPKNHKLLPQPILICDQHATHSIRTTHIPPTTIKGFQIKLNLELSLLKQETQRLLQWQRDFLLLMFVFKPS